MKGRKPSLKVGEKIGTFEIMQSANKTYRGYLVWTCWDEVTDDFVDVNSHKLSEMKRRINKAKFPTVKSTPKHEGSVRINRNTKGGKYSGQIIKHLEIGDAMADRENGCVVYKCMDRQTGTAVYRTSNFIWKLKNDYKQTKRARHAVPITPGANTTLDVDVLVAPAFLPVVKKENKPDVYAGGSPNRHGWMYGKWEVRELSNEKIGSGLIWILKHVETKESMQRSAAMLTKYDGEHMKLWAKQQQLQGTEAETTQVSPKLDTETPPQILEDLAMPKRRGQPFVIQIGQKFGLLTVKGYTGRKWPGKRNREILCECICGKEVLKNTNNMRGSYSCGCSRRKSGRKPKGILKIDENIRHEVDAGRAGIKPDDTFGLLTVKYFLSDEPSTSGYSRIMCGCVCGRRVIMDINSIREAYSCGCRRIGEKEKKPRNASVKKPDSPSFQRLDVVVWRKKGELSYANETHVQEINGNMVKMGNQYYDMREIDIQKIQ